MHPDDLPTLAASDTTTIEDEVCQECGRVHREYVDEADKQAVEVCDCSRCEVCGMDTLDGMCCRSRPAR